MNEDYKLYLDEELFLKVFVHYVCRPQLGQKTIGELKDIYTQKFKDANLPKTLVNAVPNSLNEFAKEILLQESYLMSADYALRTENCPLENIYYELPLLIQSFNPDHEEEIYGLKRWFKNFPNLNKQLDDFIKSVKELQNFVEFPDKKEETKAKIEQLVAKLKTNLLEQVYNDVAGAYLNELSKLPDDEMLTKCIVNEHFAAALKSINPLILNIKTQDKFSDIIEIYEVEKDKLEIDFQDLIIMEDLELDETLTKCKINEHFAAVLKSINALFPNTQTQEKSSGIIEGNEMNVQEPMITEDLELDETLTKCKINGHFAKDLKPIGQLLSNKKIQLKGLEIIGIYEVEGDTTDPEDTTSMGDHDEPGSCFIL